MTSLRKCLLLAASCVLLHNTAEAKESSIRTRNRRDIQTSSWVKPRYFQKYKALMLKKLKKCEALTVPPLTGDSCNPMGTDWYTCLFGEQTCPAILGDLPGLGSFKGASLGLKHPKTRCDCQGGVWMCYDWKICRTVKDTTTTPTFCGGFAGIQCPTGLNCIDDPNDGCDPTKGGRDCGGICIAPQACGSRSLPPCLEGQSCIDPDTSDNCSPLFDCPGICAPAPPQICGSRGLPSCPDGETCVDNPNNCGTALDCPGFCVPSATIPPIQTAPPTTIIVESCPTNSALNLPMNTVCSQDLQCAYGSESCCGQTFDSLICSCSAGKGFACFFTDACLISPAGCDTSPPV